MRAQKEISRAGSATRAVVNASVALVALTAALPAWAQDAAAPVEAAPAAADTATAADVESGLGDIIVTASKRSENLQRTPISVTALGSSMLETRAVVEPGQLNGLAPGVSIQPSFILLAYIRGLGNYSSQPGVDQSVAYNVDGIFISKPYGMPTIMFDQDRVEMLRGPQGTLQGRNATAGSINFISARPTMDFGAKVSVTYGNYDTLNTEGMINIPLGEGAALRVSGATAKHDGYFRNGYGDGNTAGARARLLLKPADRLEVLVTGEYTERDEKGSTYSPCPPGSSNPACEGVEWDPYAGTPGQGTDNVLNIDEDNYLRSKGKAIYAEVNYDMDFATLTWQPNYRKFTYNNHQSLSHVFGYAPAVRNSMHSQELRMASNAGSPITWVFGLYYGRESANEQNYFTTGEPPFVTINRPKYPSIGHVYFKNDINSYIYRSQSAFGQVTVPLFDGFRVLGGLRYTQDKKTQAGNTGVVLAGEDGVPFVRSVDVGGRQKQNKLNYKVGVEFDVADRVMVYGNVSTGYKAGGVNGIPPNTNFPGTFGPEEITAYQAGIKSRFLDNRAQINAEGFYYNYRGYQTSIFFTTNEGINIGGTTNSQKARIYGGEVEASFLITPQDQFDLSATVLSAIYTEFEVPEAGTSLSGERMQNAPRFTLNGNYTHTFELESGATIVAHAEARHESGQWVDYRQTDGSYQKGFIRASADITYTSPDDRYTLGAFIRNITNNAALLVANNNLGPYQLGTPYPPRTYGVRATAKF